MFLFRILNFYLRDCNILRIDIFGLLFMLVFLHEFNLLSFAQKSLELVFSYIDFEN